MSENKRKERLIAVLREYSLCESVLYTSSDLLHSCLSLSCIARDNNTRSAVQKDLRRKIRSVLEQLDRAVIARMDSIVSELRIDTDGANADNPPDGDCSGVQCGDEHGNDDDDVDDSDDILCDDCAYCPDFDDELVDCCDGDCCCGCDSDDGRRIYYDAFISLLTKLQTELSDINPESLGELDADE